MYLKKSEIITQMASCNAHFSLPFLIVLFQFISIVNGSAMNQVLRHIVLHTEQAELAGRRDSVSQSLCIFTLINTTGTTQRDGMGREEGGGFRMGNTCIPVADSF